MVDFNIVVKVKTATANQGLRRTERQLNNVGTAADRTQRLLRRAFVGLGGALVLTAAVRTLASFSQEMSTVRAITQATEGDFTSLREKAKELGATTRFSATQAAEGMTFLARAGFETNEVLGSIEGTLQLAQAGALGLGRAADIASNVLKGFRLEVEDTGRVVDVLALAANSSNTTVEQLGEAMKFVAPVAAGLGVSVEEAAAAVGTLSDAGLQASLAGTGLRRVLSELESPAKKTNDILKSVGLTADDVRVSSVGLTTAITRLAKAGVTTGQALELFGDRGGPAFEVLSTGIGSVKSLNSALLNADGTAKRIADTMDDNLNGALLAVKSATEAVLIAFGELGGESALTAGLRALADGLRFMARNMGIATQAAVSLILALALPRLQAIATGFFTAAGGATLFSRALAAATVAAKLLLRALGIGLLIEGISLLITKYNEFTTLVEKTPVTFGQAARVAADEFVNAIVNGFIILGRTMFNLVRVITDPIVTGFQALGDLIPKLLTRQVSLAQAGTIIGLTVQKAALGALLRIPKDAEEQLKQRLIQIASAADIAAVEAGRASLQPTESGTSGTTARTKAQLAANRATAEAISLTDQQKKSLQSLRDRLDPLGALTRQYTMDQKLLNDAVKAGVVTQEQLVGLQKQLGEELQRNREQRKLELLDAQTSASAGFDRFFLRFRMQAEDTATQVEGLLTGTFDKAGDAIVQFVQTGKVEFASFFRDLGAQLIKLGTNRIFAQLFGGGGASLGGGGGGAGSLISGLISAIPGFMHGGEFTVGGRAGVDQNLLSINGAAVARVSRGERVAVQSGGGGSSNVTNNFNFPAGTDVSSFKRAEGQIAARQSASASRSSQRNN